MKKLSFVAVLTLSTMLTACSSGGGSSGSIASHVPVTSLPNGSIVPGSGTNIQSVNNIEKRTKNYENAVASVKGITNKVSLSSYTEVKNNTSVKEINEAYNNMNKILVKQDFSGATKEDILLSLAMIGEYNEDFKNKNLDDLKSAVQDLKFQSKAEDVFARLGVERNLSLKDVVFYTPEYATSWGDSDGDIYSFVIDKNGNLTGLTEKDNGGSSVLEYNRIGDGVYKNNEGYVTYGFAYKKSDGGMLEDEITLKKTASLEDIRNALKNMAKSQWKYIEEETMNDLLAFIDTLDFKKDLLDEDECEEKGNCSYIDGEINNVVVQYNSIGKDVGLKYADFGSLNYNVDGERGSSMFYGGYEDLSVKADQLPQIDTEMNFVGKALAKATIEDKDDSEVSKMYNGIANLTFKDGQETLVTDFTDWHKITLKTDKTAYMNYNVSISGTAKDDTFAFDHSSNPTELAGAEIKYYGENPKNPDEAVGSVYLYEEKNDGYLDVEMVFGATRK